MINRAVLTGRLTRDPELRYTTSGTAVVSFTLAVDRQFRNQNGDRDADFINCVIWRKSAENFSNFTHKGSLVGIEGRIQTRNYENQQGNRVYVTEVVVDNFALLEPRQNGGGQAGQRRAYQRLGAAGLRTDSDPHRHGRPPEPVAGHLPGQGPIHDGPAGREAGGPGEVHQAPGGHVPVGHPA